MQDDPINQDFADEGERQDAEEFAQLLAENTTAQPEPKPGDKVTGNVVQIGPSEVFVDIGARHELPLAADQLRDADGALSCQLGDQITAYVVKTPAGLALSLTIHPGESGKAALQALQDACAAGAPIEGKVTSTNKGGFTVDLGGLRGFCPFSQMDLRRVENPQPFIGTNQRFKVLEISPDGRNIVLSRRALLQQEREEHAHLTRANLAPGAVLTGHVTRLMPYGAFIDIGGLEGLVHISQISHQRISDPSDLLRQGQEVQVEVVEIQNPGQGRRERISLSMKSLAADPWPTEAAAVPVGEDCPGKVTRLVDFGAFILLATGIEGLIHISELSDRRIHHPREVVQEGDEITVRVLEVDLKRKRISLSRRQAGDYAGD
ncbi:MAG: S1 RNA-binding domain-containing protein [Candidatus Krumholzibacteria bacterium]|jgi:small subunit ribosomal protein S1|nr:S1 RNA-binding domain-containing protein [Candidatus Krumholzibacteria bacterium]MDY0110222.1 S1 RNA-binding domain-containing protein [Candidatus Krumholzibacteria bacterium]